MKDSWKLIKVGSKVCYRRAWLRSTGNSTGDLPFARGTVLSIDATLGPEGGIASIDWKNDEIPARVAVANLALVDPQRGVLDEF